MLVVPAIELCPERGIEISSDIGNPTPRVLHIALSLIEQEAFLRF